MAIDDWGLGSPAPVIGVVTAPDRSSFVILKIDHSSIPQSSIEWRNLQSLLVNKSSIVNPPIVNGHGYRKSDFASIACTPFVTSTFWLTRRSTAAEHRT